jgi:hypothetical protein
MTQFATTKSQPLEVKYALNMLILLSLYPIAWTISMALGAVLKNQILILLTMCTWKLAWSFGSLLWVGLMVYHFVFFQSYRKKLIWPLLLMFIGCLILYMVEKSDWQGLGSQYLNLAI